MLDTTQIREPFDVAKIEAQKDPLPPLVDFGAGLTPQVPKRGRVDRRDISAAEPAGADDQKIPVAAPQGQPNGSQASRSVEDILAERQTTHGDFSDNARVMQSLKRIVHAEVGWDRLTDVQREALHMILHKVGRIISGNPNVNDHWDDIAGYAKLVSERIKP